ncbi:MAG: LamG domain-containing protein [Armatimonadota bacterium]
MFLDGGLRLLRLNAKTGRRLSETILDDKDPETGENLQTYVKGLNMTVALPDVLSTDGRNVYMRSLPFDLEGVRKKIAYTDVKQQKGEDAHLFSPTGFLDDSWWHRSYWMFGRSMASGAGGYYLAGRVAPAGRILVVGESSVYGFGRKPQYYKWTTPLEYHLFATSKELPTVEAPKRTGGSCVAVEKSESLNPADKPLTVEAWVKASNGNGVVAARGGDVHGYSLYLKGGKPQFAIRVNKQMNLVASDEAVVGKWVHLAGVLTPDKKLHVYVNGKLSASADASGFIASDPAQAMEVGADEGGAVGDYRSPFGLKGAVDELRVYHRALSPDELARHYSAPHETPAHDTALVLYYSFDGGDATDQSGNDNNGTVEGAVAAKGKLGRAMKFRGARRRGMPTLPFVVQFDWSRELPFQVRAITLAGRTLFIAGPPDLVNEEEAARRLGDPVIQKALAEQSAALEGKKGALLWAVSVSDGEPLAEYRLEDLPIFDGMAAANGRLYVATTHGKVLCFAGPQT